MRANFIQNLCVGLLLGLVAMPAAAQVHVDGSWGPVIPWPYVPVSASNMPDGRVLSWASNERYRFPSGRPEFTFTGIWDPSDNSITEIDHPSHDMFCAHQVMLEDGRVFVSGGRRRDVTNLTSVFDLDTEQWVPLAGMNKPRWYPTSLALADGTVFTAIGDGGGNTGEVYRPDTASWQLLTGLDFNPMILDYPSSSYGERDWWPLFHLAPDGSIFHSGPTPQMHTIDTSGFGSAVEVGAEFTDWYPKHSSSVMYDEGKILNAGGWAAGSSIGSTNEAYKIDLNGPSPVISSTQSMIRARKFHNGVMLPNGEVLVVGGNTSGQKFSDNGSIYSVEIWNPSTESWREGASMQVPRNYHSVALLLLDGTVLSAGGGLCNCSADHPNGQIYYPPYLYNSNGTLAARPVIQSAPAAIRAGDQFQVTTDVDVAEFSAIKMSSTTHAVNTDLRYLKVPFSGSGGTYQLDAHANPNVLTPGYWMLFAMNSSGTPSEARVIQVRSINNGDPAPQAALNLSFNSFADLSGFQLNGSASGNGAALRLTNQSSNKAGSAFYTTAATISSTTSFSTRIDFRASGSSNGGSGLALLVQGNESTALGQSGNGLGYGGVINSLAIEIDNANDTSGDTNGNHIAVHVGGDADAPLASYTPNFDLENGALHSLWVEYSSSTKILDVYLDEAVTGVQPESPIISIPNFDLPAVVGSLGFFGFSGATGTSVNNHDIEHWSLNLVSGDNPLQISPVDGTPQPSDDDVEFSVSATGEGLQYRWSFGDGTPQTGYSSSSTISHAYPGPGRYSVTVTVRDINGIEQSYQFTQSVHPPTTAEKPSASSTIIVEVETGAERVWNVNPDNNTVTVIDGATNSKLAEIPVGADPRALNLAPDGTIWVTNKDDATISVVSTSSLSVASTRQLPAGSRPHGIVFDDIGGFAFVALENAGEVHKLDVYSGTVEGIVDVGPNPRHLSITGDSNRLFVSRFITPPLPGESTTSPQTTSGGQPAGGEVVVVSPGTMTVQKTIVLEHSNRQAAELTGPGFPNYLGPAIVSPSGLTAMVPSKQDNILLGSSRDTGFPLNHEHTVRAVTSVIDLNTELDIVGSRVDHDNASVARNGAYGPYGVYAFIALEGNREVAIVDALANEEIMRIGVQFAPQSVAVSADGNRIFVHNFLDRSVTIADSSQLMAGYSDTVSVITTVDAVSAERLPADTLLGKQLFYDAADPRLAADSYMSCAACHNDGGGDGRVWDLTSMGEGLRNTISLKGHAGMGQGLLHWTSNFDEIQDFENQIRELAGGTGLMSEADFAATQGLMGAPKAGLSADLDALATYVSSLNSFERSPYRESDGSLSAQGEAGKAVYDAANCSSCHAGANFTDSPQGGAHDIGTITPATGQSQGSVITALDTPTLKGLWATAPYLHDGSAATIGAAISAHSSTSLGGASFTSAELADLEAYLQQLDDLESSSSPWQGQDIGAVGIAGSHSESSGVFTVESGDGKIWSTADEFYFVSKPLSGDGEIIARVSSISSPEPWGKAAVMIRETLDAGSANATMIVTPSKGVGFQYRTVTNSESDPQLGGVAPNTMTAPKWLRVTRSADQLAGYYSDDGTNWTLYNQVTISMANTVYVGLAVSSPLGSVGTGVFDNVSVISASGGENYVVTPDVVGQDQATAESAIVAASLVVGNATTAYSSSVASGNVISQSVVAGSSVLEGTPVDLVVSNGPQPPDSTPPTVPQDLVATAAGTSSIDLEWSASSDPESGVSGYRVYRDGLLEADITGTSHSSTGLTANTNYSYTVLAYNAVGLESGSSNAVNATTSSSSPWQGQDIGAVGIAGSHSESSGVFTVESGDGKIWSTADEFYFVSKPLSGDGEIIARVSSISSPQPWGKAAVMIRETLDAGSTNATMIVTPSKGVGFQYRTVTDGASDPKLGGVAPNTMTAPKWLRVTRSADQLAGYYSDDGTNWTLYNQVTISMANTVYVGLAVSSPLGSVGTGVFDNVSVISASGGENYVVTPDVVGQDQATAESAIVAASLVVGNATTAYSSSVASGNVISQSVVAGSSVLEGTPVDLVVSNGPQPPDSTPPTVPQDLVATAAGTSSIDLEWSASSDPESGVSGYRVYRDGLLEADITGTSHSSTGLTANTNYSYTVLAYNAVGLESGSSNAVNATTSSSSPWQGQDIGAVGIAGSHSESSGVFTVESGDGKIWSTADEFYFVSKPLSGDGEIIARVSSISSPQPWGKAAVMIRETLDAGSTNATMIVTPSKGVGFQYRTVTDGASDPKLGGVAPNTMTAPKWLRVTRSADQLAGYYSDDGTNWTLYNQVTISMANTVYVGLAVSSPLGSVGTGVFDNVSVLTSP